MFLALSRALGICHQNIPQLCVALASRAHSSATATHSDTIDAHNQHNQLGPPSHGHLTSLAEALKFVLCLSTQSGGKREHTGQLFRPSLHGMGPTSPFNLKPNPSSHCSAGVRKMHPEHIHIHHRGPAPRDPIGRIMIVCVFSIMRPFASSPEYNQPN